MFGALRFLTLLRCACTEDAMVSVRKVKSEMCGKKVWEVHQGLRPKATKLFSQQTSGFALVPTLPTQPMPALLQDVAR